MKYLMLLFMQHAILVQATNPLEVYRWKQRIIVIQSGDDHDLAMRQYQSFTDQLSEMEDRDLIILRVRGEEVRLFDDLTSMSAQGLAAACGLEDETFSLTLVGKDGGVKLSSSEIVDPRDVYALIDQMPMRRSEMKSRGD